MKLFKHQKTAGTLGDLPEPLPATTLGDFPEPITAQIAAKVTFSKLKTQDPQDPIRFISSICRTDKRLKNICDSDDYWKFMCTEAEFDRKDRPRADEEDRKKVSWQKHFEHWWHLRFDDESLNRAVQAKKENQNNFLWRFNQERDLSDFGEIGTWYVNDVKSMANLFHNYEHFDGDISLWNVSNVTDMDSMFEGATITLANGEVEFRSEFNQDLSKWDVSKVKNMAHMFEGATNFEGKGLSEWGLKVGNVTHMQRMFKGATKFKENLSDWKSRLGNVVRFDRMFENAAAFNTFPQDWRLELPDPNVLPGMFQGTPLDGSISFTFAGILVRLQPQT